MEDSVVGGLPNKEEYAPLKKNMFEWRRVRQHHLLLHPIGIKRRDFCSRLSAILPSNIQPYNVIFLTYAGPSKSRKALLMTLVVGADVSS